MSAALRVKVRYLSDVYEQERLRYAKEGDAGVDLRLTERLVLAPGECKKVGLGVAFHIQSGHACMLLLPRSGTGSAGLVLGNLVGLIDSGYQGEIIAAAWNRNTDQTIEFPKGAKVAQALFLPFLQVEFQEVSEFEATERGASGFGSTG